jgi:hypothetical protein
MFFLREIIIRHYTPNSGVTIVIFLLKINIFRFQIQMNLRRFFYVANGNGSDTEAAVLRLNETGKRRDRTYVYHNTYFDPPP